MNRLLKAIVDDDQRAAEQLLKADGGLATRLIRKPRLYVSERVLKMPIRALTLLYKLAGSYRWDGCKRILLVIPLT